MRFTGAGATSRKGAKGACGVDVSGWVQVRGDAPGGARKGTNKNCVRQSVYASAVNVDALLYLVNDFCSAVTVTKKELRSSAGLGRLTDPSVWAELEALYSNCQNVVTWVRTFQAAKIYPGTSRESGTPFTDTTMGEVEWINGDLAMQK
ncbi:hypothetical protein INS49_000473 [Diaporthe citri]|uniref:uncharacterized protein n=1 Tax=Diaporthe citri TaxID=83186 RepID=UPI001C813E12|nr:uncharacterized protein INS49_000473 [Diaporthe citri]KAG6366297.1 hypothetical protein INS49_000473 [Diaporthe citri]